MDDVILFATPLHLLHANFHGPLTILAATFPQKNVRTSGFARFAHKCARCARAIAKLKMSFCRHRPSPPSCRFSSPSFAHSYNFLLINRELVGAPCEATTILLWALRSRKRRWQIVGNILLYLHAEFHCHPSLLAK